MKNQSNQVQISFGLCGGEGDFGEGDGFDGGGGGK